MKCFFDSHEDFLLAKDIKLEILGRKFRIVCKSDKTRAMAPEFSDGDDDGGDSLESIEKWPGRCW